MSILGLRFVPFCFTMMSITVVSHHDGEFTKKWILEYEGSSESAVKGQDVEKWSYFEDTSIVKDLRYEFGTYRLWWKVEEDFMLRKFLFGDDALKIAEYSIKFGVEAHSYIEHFEQFAS